MEPATRYYDRFATYFERDIANQAAKSLANGVEIELSVGDSSGAILETFTFTRKGGKNAVISGPAADPQLAFRLTTAAAEEILNDPSQDIGSIGVNIAKLSLSTDANRRVSVQFKAGFLTLYSKGYFGVLKTGGAVFGQFLASKGLSGLDAIKAALKSMRG